MHAETFLKVRGSGGATRLRAFIMLRESRAPIVGCALLAVPSAGAFSKLATAWDNRAPHPRVRISRGQLGPLVRLEVGKLVLT